MIDDLCCIIVFYEMFLGFVDLILFANLYWKIFIKVIFILIKNLYLKH